MLTLPDLNRLKVFHAVYEQRSLVGAARALHITRSAVSQSLKLLEEELRQKLFLRDSKKVTPTEAATRLFGSIEPFLVDLRAVVSEMESGHQVIAGKLRMGAPQDFGSTVLTEVLVEFRKRYPEVTFELTLAVPVTLLEELSAGKLDLAFVDNGDVHAKDYPVSITAARKEKFILIAAKKYFEEKVGNLNPKLAEMKAFDFVDYLPQAPVTKIWMKHHFGKALPEVKVSFSAESVRAVVGAVKGGFGLAVVPEPMVAAELKSGKLVELFPNGRPLVNQISLARRLERTPTKRENAFVQFYRDITSGH